MATSLLFYVILVACVVTDETSGSSRGNFLLENCRKHNADLLSLLDYDREQTWRQQMNLLHRFFYELWQIVLPKRIWKRAAVLDQFTANNVTIDVREWKFRSGKHFFELQTEWVEENGEMPASNISSIIKLKIQLVERLFREMHGVRKNATHVAVVFVNGENLTYEEISSVPSIVQNHSTQVKIFVVIFGNKLVKEVTYLTDTLVLPHMELAKFHHYLLMAICNTCANSWYKFHHKDSASFMSCYKVIHTVEFGWEEGMSHCSNLFNGFLAGFETPAEMEFFQYIVVEYRNMNNLAKRSDNYGLIWNIGLQRDSSNYAKRFHWVTSSTMYRPLLIKNWLPGKPSTGCVPQNCAIWKSTSKRRSDRNHGNISQTNSPATFWFVEGWEDVECRSQVTNVSLCEVTLPRRVQDMNLFNMTPAPKASFESALRKGNFRRLRGNIVSTSVNVENPAFLQNLRDSNESFPIFDCEEDAVDRRYISYSLVCDFIDHCSNKRDEVSCLNPRGLFDRRRAKKYRNYCLTGQKLQNWGDNCDNIINCRDNSDEQSCFDHPCDSVRCFDGSCLPRQWINDGEIDCSLYVNGSRHFKKTDESPLTNAFLPKNNSCALICNLSICIDVSRLNNTIVDCTGPEGPLDETIGKLEPANTCRSRLGNYIWAPRCHYIKDKYGGIIGCRDMSHLRDCSNFQCGDGYVKCYQSYCIPRQYLRDGKSDCPTGEDEQSFYTGPCNGNFACWGSTNCLHPDLVCNGYSDCPHNDDELDCDVRCPEMFRCIAGTATLLNYSNTSPLNLGRLSPVDRRTRYLDLTGTKLSGFEKFVTVNVEVFLNLKVLILSNCSLSQLPMHSFELGYKRDLPFVIQKLDISYNDFKYFINNNYTYYYKNINYLNISYNKDLRIIKNLRFRFLEIIDFSHTKVSYLNQFVFAWLPKLKHLNLSHTLISDFSGQYFPSSFTLHTLDLLAIRTKHFHDYRFHGLTISQTLNTDHFQICCPQIQRELMKSQAACNAPVDLGAISTCSDLVGLSVQRVLLWVVAVLAVLGNLTVIAYRVTWDRSVLRTGYGLFVTNLGVADFIMGVYLFIIAGADHFFHGHYILHDEKWRNSVVCKMAGFMACLSCEASTFFVFLITCDRYLVIKYPFGQIRFSTFMKSVLVTTSWVASILLSLLPIVFSFEIYTSNPMCLGLPLTNTPDKGWEYSVGVFIVFNFLMFVFIAYGQYAIFRTISDNRISRTGSNVPCSRRAEDITVAKQLSLVVLSNFLFWFPVGLMGMMSLCGYAISGEVYAWTTVLLLPINSAVNPVLYTIPALMARWETFKRGDHRTFVAST